MEERFSLPVHAFEVMVTLATEGPQPERVDEATRATDVTSASAPRVSHNTTISRIKSVPLRVILAVELK